MNEDYELVLSNVEFKSKAKRLFRLFPVKEILSDEPFEAELTFKNVGTKEFSGGYFSAHILYSQNFFKRVDRVDIPKLNPNESKIIKIGSWIPASGPAALEIRSIWEKNGVHISVKDKWDRTITDTNVIYSFRIVSKEEIYQKYSAIIALWASISAIIISTISLLVSLFK